MEGGLPTPRPVCEIVGAGGGKAVLQGRAQVVSVSGVYNTAAYLKGAKRALELAKTHQVTMAILKARSPSCGNKFIYDGSFKKKAIDGMGVTAALLIQNGIKVFSEDQLDLLC